ncbi:MAG: ATP-dependent sacrificial sulfur transferase LarE [Campylobacteraceae bacterium]|nr:ATP-dependent sacrificial sulfur transferase LarE [Campylobacteraceae bacterium]
MNTAKLEQIKAQISKLDNLIVAFSGGVDSSLLAKIAGDVLGKKALAVTIKTHYMSETEDAISFAKMHGINHQILELPIHKEMKNNPNLRCYICKKYLFTEILKFAQNLGFSNLADGTNKDDLNEFRPGLKASSELGVISPLKNLTKDEVRALSKELGLSTFDKPSNSCVLTRFPYNYKFSECDINLVKKVENLLKENKLKNIRARFDGVNLKLEMSYKDMVKFSANFKDLVKEIDEILGGGEILLDLKGLRNEVLK